MAKVKSANKKLAAIIARFEGPTADSCAAVRHKVDGVLSGVSSGGISATTSNDDLLKLYVIPDKIQFLYILLNQALSGFIGFKLFLSTDIKDTATVGDVRDAASKKCGLDCSHI